MFMHNFPCMLSVFHLVSNQADLFFECNGRSLALVNPWIVSVGQADHISWQQVNCFNHHFSQRFFYRRSSLAFSHHLHHLAVGQHPYWLSILVIVDAYYLPVSLFNVINFDPTIYSCQVQIKPEPQFIKIINVHFYFSLLLVYLICCTFAAPSL